MRKPDLSYKAALSRSRVSAPCRYLQKNNLLLGRVLDYGCGKGLDADVLGIEKYDPYFFPEKPKGKFDTIVCNYVLNAVSTENVTKIIADIDALLDKRGTAYLTVRADIFGDRYTNWGTYQRNVILPLPVETKTNWFRMYRYRKI